MSEAKKIVLIVEDENHLRQALVDKFSREGFSILEAHNGEEGLKIANSSHPDIILLDIIMPRMDGLTMLKTLRQSSEWGEGVPVIILTNLAEDEKINEAVTINEPSYYLIKSDWKLEDVVQKVKDRLSNEDI
jgi:DNA-binding response OmpR family regulator